MAASDLDRRVRSLALWSVRVAILSVMTFSAAFAQTPRVNEGVERLKADVYYLASNTLEGRGSATPGIELAAQHIRAEFRRVGLKSGTSDGRYFQPFEYRHTPQSAPIGLCNVIGVLEGRGEVSNETIVIGAHFDHLGHGTVEPTAPKNRLYPGADDNASGTALMLELARRFASRDTPPRRRMVFIAFGGEEAGLIGSGHYVSKEPLFPINDTVTMVNFDMVGRLREKILGIAGNESASEFAKVLADADAQSPLKLRLAGPECPEDSDHAPFARAGIPFMYICTGSHDDRHTPGDTADKVDYEGLEAIASFCEDVMDRLQILPRPTFQAPPVLAPSGSK